MIIFVSLIFASINSGQAKRDSFLCEFDASFTSAHMINKSKLEDFLRAIIHNRNLIEESVEKSHNTHAQHTNHLDAILNWCLNIKEKLKCLVALIYGVHFEAVEACVARMNACEKAMRLHQTGRAMKEKQPLMSMSVDLNGEGDESGASTDSSLMLIYSNLVEACNDAMHAIGTFLNCAASSFYWHFRLTPVYSTSTSNNNNRASRETTTSGSYDSVELLEIIQADEKVAVYFSSLSRLSGFLAGLSGGGGDGGQLTSDEFYLKFSIWHGVKQLDTVIIKLDRLDKLLSKKVDFFSMPHR